MNECSYADGYIHQKVNLCRTCSTEERCVAVCVGCSLDCHLEHDIVELWAKPSMRCDCGTGSLAPCRLRVLEQSAPLNENNYVPAHNFKSLFCWCRKPYAYEADTVMVQCNVCTDWFHDACITAETGAPVEVRFEEGRFALCCCFFHVNALSGVSPG